MTADTVIDSNAQQVRRSCCFAFCQIGPKAAAAALPALSKVRASGCELSILACWSSRQHTSHVAVACSPHVICQAMLDGTANRDELANTIVALGPLGEQLLLKRLNATSGTCTPVSLCTVHKPTHKPLPLSAIIGAGSCSLCTSSGNINPLT